MSSRTPDEPGSDRSERLRIVADLGNSRLKWGRLDASGNIAEVVSLPLDDASSWEIVWHGWNPSGAVPSSWRIASVNPPLAERLGTFLTKNAVYEIAWFRTVRDVPIASFIQSRKTAGADRAIAVLGAKAMRPVGQPGLVVLCGSAITVERVGADGTWQGGAIGPGLFLSAKALFMQTAQLPLINLISDPPAWGRSTIPALQAGVYLGVVGAIRELLTRQSEGLLPTPWVVFSGGDAEALCKSVGWAGAEVIPDLVLRGLAYLSHQDH